MIWIVLTVAVLVCGLLLCCVYVLSNKICSLKRQVRELNEKIGIANCFPEYSRVYLNDAPVGKGRQIRIRCGLFVSVAVCITRQAALFRLWLPA